MSTKSSSKASSPKTKASSPKTKASSPKAPVTSGVSPDDINKELIRLINVHARRDHKKYEYSYSPTAPKSDLIIAWPTIVAGISERFTANKKQFKISHWKVQMKGLANSECISKVKWRA